MSSKVPLAIELPCLKRTRNELTFDEKIRLINYAKDNPKVTQRQLAEMFKTGRSTVSEILKKKDVYLKSCVADGNAKRKRLEKDTKFRKINEAVFEWFKIASSSGVPLSGPVIQAKAKEIGEQLGVDGFTASNGWLEKFKKRHNVKNYNYKPSEESTSMNIEAQVAIHLGAVEDSVPAEDSILVNISDDDDMPQVICNDVSEKDALIYVSQLITFASENLQHCLPQLLYVRREIEKYCFLKCFK